MNATNQTAIDYLWTLADQGFWGFLTLKFEHGEVVHLRREENLKPNELPGKNRKDYDSIRAH
ncbi:MAG TPA: hypothetical protein VFF64_24520 [Candidatus Eremiobacteraceae bacterium]|nr:hypothetical protein [Candidatus Eremiobacteraceae bacterium]